jgi:hypothetical protein
MKRSKLFKRGIGIAITIAFLAAGCAHTTLITTSPSGANVTIAGNNLGASPVSFSDTSGIPQTFFVKINKSGYKEINVPIKQAYKGDITLFWLLPGIIPYFFIATLNDSYSFNLEKK